MITRTEAERIALAIHTVRQDWPTASITTLIIRDLNEWPLLDLFVGLAHVAAEQNLDGTWVSQTPARVKENGPWRTVGISDVDAEHQRHRDEQDRQSRLRQIQVRNAAIAACTLCDERGYRGTTVCDHDPTTPARHQAGVNRVRAALTRR